MSPDLLRGAKKALKENTKLNDEKINKLIRDVRLWKKGDIIYPSRIKDLLSVTMEEAYSILSIIMQLNILILNFKMYCSQCETYVKTPILESLNEFPDNLTCDSNHKLNPLRDVIVIYKVIKTQ